LSIFLFIYWLVFQILFLFLHALKKQFLFLCCTRNEKKENKVSRQKLISFRLKFCLLCFIEKKKSMREWSENEAIIDKRGDETVWQRRSHQKQHIKQDRFSSSIADLNLHRIDKKRRNRFINFAFKRNFQTIPRFYLLFRLFFFFFWYSNSKFRSANLISSQLKRFQHLFLFIVYFQVSMMEEGGTAARIKQEIDSCCSPSPTSSNNNVSILSFGSSGQEPVNSLNSQID
jgi:hypothetical protein